MGVRLGALLEVGHRIWLEGPLGAGKTLFAQGLARGLGVDEPEAVSSPTYAIIHVHAGARPLLHCDLYRIEDPREIDALGLLDLLDDHVVAVEWPERAAGLLGPPTVRVAIAEVPGAPHSRAITLSTCVPEEEVGRREERDAGVDQTQGEG